MRVLFLTVLAGLAAATTAAAQPHDAATLCLDPGGINHAPVCKQMQASRFPQTPDICQCHGPYRQVDAPWCGPGEKPPADSAEFDRARAAYVDKNGSSLFGASYHGQSMCVVKGEGG